MPKLSPVSFSELVRKLTALDFEGPFSGGKHLFMVKGDLRLTIPNPHRQDIGVDRLNKKNSKTRGNTEGRMEPGLKTKGFSFLPHSVGRPHYFLNVIQEAELS